jgi:hypothetical protein
MNPFDGVAKFFLGMLEQKTIQNWARLIFELLCSGILSFLFVCGSILAAPPHSWAIASGTGMVVAAVCMTVVFRRSPLTKGLLLVLPSQEALKELSTDIEVIQKS